MSDCPWEPIKAFESPGEFNRFLTWMDEQIQAGAARELRTVRWIDHIKEKWFIHVGSGQVWRLSWPDPPVAPSFERVRSPGAVLLARMKLAVSDALTR